MSPTAIPGNLLLKNGMVITGSEKNPVDLYRSNVSLLLHGDGANGSTTIVDSSPSPKTVTAFGDAQISTAQSKFGGSSFLFDGNDSLQITNFAAFQGAFTVELFCYLSSLPSFGSLLGFGTINSANSFYLATNTAGQVLYRLGSATSHTSSATITTGEWNHIGFTRDNAGLCRLFVNAVDQPTATATKTQALSSDNLGVGSSFGGGFGMIGHLDEIRITTGIARVIAVPTLPFPDA
jgi:hypothetical protein